MKGRTICVTGAGRGIGRAIAEKLNALGATVVAADRTLSEDSARYSDLAVAMDVTKEADWEALAGRIADRYGSLSGLVSNAGISLTSPLAETSLEDWRKVQAVNVEGVILGMRTMLPLLRRQAPQLQGGATIVNMSSVGGLRGSAFNMAYTASKGAVLLLSKSAAREFAALGYQIRVNTVHPGGIQTDMIDAIYDRYAEIGRSQSREDAEQASAARHPLGRLGTPVEIAEAVAFLSSEKSAFMTGAQLVADGGLTAF